MRPTFIAFTLRLLVSTFDLIIDWLLYYEVSGLKPGLVFGPFSDAVLGLFVFFGCIGTVIYIVEIVLNVVGFFAAKDDLLPNGLLNNVNLVSLWIEDVPLIMMSVYMAGCRDKAVTVLMLVKALSTLLEVFVNLGIIIAEYILNKKHTTVIKFGEKEAAKWLKIPLGISLFIMMIGSMLVFGLGNYYTGSKNVIRLSSPLGVNSGKYSSLNYLDGSGIYMNFDNGQTDVITMDTYEWISLIDLESIMSTNSSSFMVRVTYDSNPNTRLWIQSSSSSDLSSPESSTCYSTQTSPLSILTTCSTDFEITSNTKSIVFKFVYESPSNSKPLGDVYYNYGMASIETMNPCFLPEATPEFSLSYFKATSNKHNSSHLMTLSNVSGHYYKSGSDLQDVSEAWRTGKFGCGHTGRSIPKLETSISVPCLVWGLTRTLSTSTSPTTTTTLSKTTTSVVNNSTHTVNTTSTTPVTVNTTSTTPVTVNTTSTTPVTVNTTSTTPVTVNTTSTTPVTVNTTSTTPVTVNTTSTTPVTVNTTNTTPVTVNTTSTTPVTVNTTSTTPVTVNTTSTTPVTVNTTSTTPVTVNTTSTTPVTVDTTSTTPVTVNATSTTPVTVNATSTTPVTVNTTSTTPAIVNTTSTTPVTVNTTSTTPVIVNTTSTTPVTVNTTNTTPVTVNTTSTTPVTVNTTNTTPVTVNTTSTTPVTVNTTSTTPVTVNTSTSATTSTTTPTATTTTSTTTTTPTDTTPTSTTTTTPTDTTPTSTTTPTTTPTTTTTTPTATPTTTTTTPTGTPPTSTTTLTTTPPTSTTTPTAPTTTTSPTTTTTTTTAPTTSTTSPTTPTTSVASG
ncbi:mucin-5AC-like [Pecten maximus]|uniref:mucin-5AC-like n=1 Tax=Pecten maximus TaxID=6579 RepID=UPI001458AC74|nr:mucin-5AC-like [Pecten maximus]